MRKINPDLMGTDIIQMSHNLFAQMGNIDGDLGDTRVDQRVKVVVDQRLPCNLEQGFWRHTGQWRQPVAATRGQYHR